MTANNQDAVTSQDGTTQTLSDCQGCGVPVWGEKAAGGYFCACCLATYRTERAAFEGSRQAATA